VRVHTSGTTPRGDDAGTTSVRSASRRGSPLRYLALTFGWTWSWWWGAVLLDVAWLSPAGGVMFALGGVGPVLAAAVLVQRGRHPDTPREFWRRLLDGGRVRRQVWAAVLVLALLPAVVGRAVDGSGGSWIELGAAAVLVTAVVAAVLEEPGWRGYLQDVLQRRHGALPASLAVGLVWALWHLPLFFFVGSYQHELGRWNGLFALYGAALLAWGVIYAWVYVRSGRSILAAVVLHAAANAAGELVPSEGSERYEVGVLLVVAVLCAASLVRRGQEPAPAA
jgi:uncharacterized protein